jgi:hypothetical protein
MAWSDTCHRIICEIAFPKLEQTAREHATEQLYGQGSDHLTPDALRFFLRFHHLPQVERHKTNT